MSVTPILDRLTPLPPVHSAQSRGAQRTVFYFLSGMLGAVMVSALVTLAGGSLDAWLHDLVQALFPGGPTVGRSLSVVGALLASTLLAVAIHESGHLLGGLCAGFRFVQLRIGPLHIDHPFRISFKRSPGSGALGWVGMVPTHTDRLRARAALFVLGGPGINLACAVALLVSPLPRGVFWSSLLVVSLAVGVLALLPLRHRIVDSDGRRLWLLFRDPVGCRRWLALMRLGAEVRAGVLPESFSEEALADALAPRDESPDAVSANQFAYASAWHRHQDVDAACFLERSLQLSSSAVPAPRRGLMSEAAVFQARRRQRPDLAEQWLADMPESSCPRWLRTRVEAAIREARGDLDGALAKLDELERDYDAIPDRAARGMLLRLLERWRSELRRASVDQGSSLEQPERSARPGQFERASSQ